MKKRGLVKWQDFTGDSLPSEGIDEDGHGSLMATLVMVSAPLAAEIYVIRVARRRDEILNCRSNIAKVDEPVLYLQRQTRVYSG